MPDYAALFEKYGWGIALAAIALFNIAKIIAFIEKIIGAFVPEFKVWREKRGARMDRRQEAEIKERADTIELLHQLFDQYRSEVDRSQAVETKERLDTIILLKDLLMQYRCELEDAKLARRQADTEMLGAVKGYERLSAQVVEVLRDIAESIRAQTARLDKLQENVD